MKLRNKWRILNLIFQERLMRRYVSRTIHQYNKSNPRKALLLLKIGKQVGTVSSIRYVWNRFRCDFANV